MSRQIPSGFPCRIRWMQTLLLVACVFATATGKGAPELSVEELNTELSWPWALAFLPDGGYLVTQRSGELVRLDEDGTEIAMIEGVPEAYVAGQGGLMDILLARDFASSGQLYLSMAVGELRSNTGTIVRGRLVGDSLEDVETVFEVRPNKRTPQHYGARLAWLPDGTLLMTTGDGFDHREDPQRLDSGLGKTLRIHPDGSIPEDNPLVDREGALPEIWTFGHRNPQGLAVTPDGTVWQTEHGAQGGDELNRLQPGANYGWPVVTLGIDYTGASISPFREYSGMENPQVDWTPSIGASGLAWYGGNLIPEWRGDLFAGGLAIPGLYRIDLDGQQVREWSRVVPQIDTRVREVRAGPDGALYLLTDGDPGRLLRIAPSMP